MIVVDSNIIVYLFLTSARSGQVEQLLGKDPEWAAPLLWRSEFCNVLALYIHKRLMSLDAARQIMDEALRLMAGREYQVVSPEVLRLAAKSSCSAYDCEFAALAQDLGVALVTVDKQVLDQFPQVATSLDSYLSSHR